MTVSASRDTTTHAVDGTSRRSNVMDDDRAVKARLFGDDRSDPMIKQVIKNRLLRELQVPTGGDETSFEDGHDTQPVIPSLPNEPVRVGRFAILRKLGHGGMGVVYAAYDEQLERKVAVKLLRHELSRDERGRTRMLREAQALARISHPNVVQVHEVGTWRDHDYVAMEFVQGRTLERWMDELQAGEKARPWKDVLDVMIQAGRGLAAAHAHQLVHRDFKPGNVMVGDDGRVRVLDFGLARSTHERSGSHPRALEEVEETMETLGDEPELRPLRDTISGSAFDKVLTATGAIMGTPAYMAPEQHLGRPATELSDQFSFCVVLYETLFGERPYKASSRADYAFKVSEGAFEQPGPHSGVPAWLRKIVFRGLAPYPGNRWPSMDALLSELTRERGRIWKWSLAAAGFVAVIATGAMMSPAPAPVCEIDGSTLAGVWDASERERVQAAFRATGLEHAEQALSLVEARLDEYAEQLVGARVDACEDRMVRNEQTDAQYELRGACLEQRTRELRATVDALAGADPGVVERAAELVDGLGDVGMCERVDLLERGWLVAKDAGVAKEVAGLRDQIAEGHALRLAGHVKEAQVIAAAVEERAKELDYGPLLAEALYLRGRLEQHADEIATARETLRRSALLSEQFQHFELAATVWIELAAIDDQGVVDSPLQLTAYGMATVALDRLHAPTSDVRRIDLSTALAIQYLARGRYVQALENVDAAISLLHEEAPRHVNRTLATQRLRAAILEESGDLAGAEEAYREGWETAARTRGAASLACANFDVDLGLVLLATPSKADEGVERLRRARAGFEARYGSHANRLIHIDLALASHALGAGKYDEALADVRRAVELLPPGHEDRNWGIDALAIVLANRGDDEEALRVFGEAIRLHEAEGRAMHPRLAYVLSERGYLHLRHRNYADALEDFERAGTINSAALEATHPDQLLVDVGRGEALLGLADYQRALDTLSDAYRRSATADLPSELKARLAWGYARALEGLDGSSQRSRGLASEAFALLSEKPSAHALLAEIEAFLAR